MLVPQITTHGVARNLQFSHDRTNRASPLTKKPDLLRNVNGKQVAILHGKSEARVISTSFSEDVHMTLILKGRFLRLNTDKHGDFEAPKATEIRVGNVKKAPSGHLSFERAGNALIRPRKRENGDERAGQFLASKVGQFKRPPTACPASLQ